MKRLYKLRRFSAIFFASLILFLTPAGSYLDTQHIQKVEATGVGTAVAGIMSVVPGGQAVVIGLLAGMGIGIAWQNRDKIAETAKSICDDIKEKFSSWAEEEAQEMVDSGEAETLEEAITQTESYQSIQDLEALDEEFPADTVGLNDTIVIANTNDRVSRLSRHVYRYMQSEYNYNGTTKTMGDIVRSTYRSNWSYNDYSNSFLSYVLSGSFTYSDYFFVNVGNVKQYVGYRGNFASGTYCFVLNDYNGSFVLNKYVDNLCAQYNITGSYGIFDNWKLTTDGSWGRYGSSVSICENLPGYSSNISVFDSSSFSCIGNIPVYRTNVSDLSSLTLGQLQSCSTLLYGNTTGMTLDDFAYNPSMMVSSAPYQNVGSISLQNSDIYSAAEQAAADALAGNPDLTEAELNAIRVQAIAGALDVDVTDAPVIDVPGTGGNTGEDEDDFNNIPYVPPVGLPEGAEIGDAAQQVIDQSITNTNGIIGGLQSLLDALLNLPGKIAQAFVSLFSTLFGWLSNILSTIRVGFENVGEWIMDIPQTLDEQFADVQEWIMDIPITLEQGFSDVLEWIMDIPVTLENQLANVQEWIMDIPIPDTAEITQPIIDTIDDAISVDTDVVQETIAAEQTAVWNLPFFDQAQALFDSFHFSDTVYYPKIKITTPDILRPYYKQPEIILLDFEDYKDYCLWVRLLCRAILWLALVWHIVDLATPKLRIT